jgi:hypothetical protein
VVGKYEHQFCDRDCYNNYRRLFRVYPEKVKKDTFYQRQLKGWAKIYAERNKSERIDTL